MAFDSSVMAGVVTELRERLLGGRISKIYQPEHDELALLCYSAGSNHRLLLSANPRTARIHLTGVEKKNPPSPPMFCMLMRKYIEGGRIVAIDQVGRDRICRIRIGATDELGNPVEFTLVVEVMGKHSNIILLNPQGRIVDAIRRVTEEVNRHRELLPGLPYVPPPATGKIDPLALTPEALASAALGAGRGDSEAAPAAQRGDSKPDPVGQVANTEAETDAQVRSPDQPAWQLLLDTVDGLGPMLAKEAVARTGLPFDASVRAVDFGRLVAAVQALVATDTYEPRLLFDEGDRLKEFHILPLVHWPGRSQAGFPSISACLDGFYGGRAEEEHFRALRGSLAKLVRDEVGRVRRKRKAQQESLETAESAETFRVQGELITANLWQLQKGQTEAQVVNYYDPDGGQVVVKLDPELSPAENAQAYYHRYQKARSGLAMIQEQLAKSTAEQDYLEQVEVALDQAESLPDLEEVRRELIAEGYISERATKGDRSRAAGDRRRPSGDHGTSRGGRGNPGSRGTSSGGQGTSPGGRGKGAGETREQGAPLTLRSTDGLEIWVGRNNRQNDYLTMKLAGPQDLWFHTKEIPGSHVILRVPPGREVPERAIHEAAALAAYHSKARLSSSVPVDYTARKHVRKPHGARPGMVIYDNQTTLWVTPDPERVPFLKGGQHNGGTGTEPVDTEGGRGNRR